MDSLTRFAQAQREIALAIGEPRRLGVIHPLYLREFPNWQNSAGNGEEGGGSITAFYTVLTDGDAENDPIAESAGPILDGHIVLIT